MTSRLQNILSDNDVRVADSGTTAVAETPEAVAEIYRFAEETEFRVKLASRDIEPSEKEIVLLPGERLTGELYLAPEDFYVESPATARLSELDDYLRESGVGLHLPLITARGDAPLGELIAVYPGNLLAPIYGEIPRLLLGITAVRPNGEVVDFGRRTIKGVAGYNLSGTFTGARGRGGVIVRARWRLFPIPESRAVFAFESTPDDWEAKARMVFGVPLRFDGKRAVYFEGSPARIAAVLGLERDGFGGAAEIACDDDARAILSELAEETGETG
ncbi:MAG: FAD-binding oxidoreductase [bacterium]|nr:FAD-binding oxidoreductase [bacterium]